MSNYKDELYLQHFGVIGMKWGQRRSNKALNGAKVIRSIGGKYAESMAKKQTRIKKEANQKISSTLKESSRRIKDAKAGEKAIKSATEKYASAMEKKAKNIVSKAAERRLRKTDPAAARHLVAVRTSGSNFAKKFHEKRLADINSTAAKEQRNREAVSSILDAFFEED